MLKGHILNVCYSILDKNNYKPSKKDIKEMARLIVLNEDYMRELKRAWIIVNNSLKDEG